MRNDLAKLIAETRNLPMSQNQLEQQRQSFAYGNANIANPAVTREAIAIAAELIRRQEEY